MLPNGDTGSIAKRELNLFVILMGLEVISGATLIAASVALLWSNLRPRRGLN
jgi:hypothetical protein